MAGYITHFGLQIAPFSTTPDPQFAFATREHQLAVAKIEYAVEERQGIFLLQGEIGTGKCLGKGTPVLMFDGTVKAVEEVQIGDLLMGPDSQPRRVLSLACGVEPLYRVVPCTGDAYVVNQSHILSLKMTRPPKEQDAHDDDCPSSRPPVHLSVQEYLTRPVTFRRQAKGWRTGVDFPAKPVPFDPYFLGLWLGDGCSSASANNTAALLAVDFLQDHVDRRGLRLAQGTLKGDWCPDFDLYDASPLRTSNLPAEIVSERGRPIPYPYRTNSREARMALLAGLIDANGSLRGNGYDLVLKQGRLVHDVLFLACSLGFAAFLRPCRKICTNRDGGGEHHHLHISGDIDTIPVRIPRKKAAPRQRTKDWLLTSIHVEPIGEGAYYGFEIDGDGLFLLGDFTVTHNTTVAQFMLNNWREDKSTAVAHITNPSVRTPSQFLRLLLAHFGMASPYLLQDNWDALRSLLVGNYKEGRNTVAVIDEAQTISPENMETLTHISNEQTQKCKLIQIVLLAQPNILRKLTYKPALRDRIAHGSTLNPLSFEDAVGMLRHRVRVAGGNFDTLFPGELPRRIYNNTKGIPRRLCMLCDNMLLNAYALRKPTADEETLNDALQDLAFKGWKGDNER